MRKRAQLAAGAILMGVTLFSSGLTANAQNVDAPNHAAELPDFSISEQPSSELYSEPNFADDYWTPERIASAVPLDAPEPTAEQLERSVRIEQSLAPVRSRIVSRPVNAVDPVHPIGPSAKSSLDPGTMPPGGGDVLIAPPVHGKLLFTVAGVASSCSASVINTGSKNQILTAGHCVHSQIGPVWLWHQNHRFIPAFWEGNEPYGRWISQGVKVTNEWRYNRNAAFDYATIELQPLDGRKIVEAVGANGIAFDATQNVPGTVSWGWPGNSPWNGQRSGRCSGTTTPAPAPGLSSDALLICGMGKGWSGGAWMKDVGTNQLGYTYAAWSRCFATLGNCDHTNAVATPLRHEAMQPLMN